MENRQCRFFAMVIVANIIVSLTTKADSTITGQNISVSNRASILADYFIQHEFESHYVYESALAARELIHHVSPGNTSATSELLDAMASYVLVSMPDFLRDPIVQDIAKVIVDEAEHAFQRSNLILNSSNPISEDEMQQILSQFDFVKALTRSITIAKPLIEQYRQEDDSSVYIILLNKAIEVTAYAISTPTFQTVMDIAIEELSQGFLKSGLPERIAKEGTEFLDDSNNTLSIVKTIIESSNTQRLISRSYKVSKPVLDNLYNGDTLFLYTLLTEATGDSTGNSQDPSFLYYFKMLESEFLKTNNKQNQSNGVPASIISEPLSFANVLGQMNLQSVIVSLLGSESAREMLPYNSSVEEDKISDVCYEDMIDFLDAAKDEKEWALQILDSYGKVNPGLLQGNLHFIGSMEQCSKSRSNIKPGEILGNIPRTHQRYPRTLGYRYCRADLLITKEMEEILLQDVNVEGIEIPAQLRITWGMCVPDTCSGSDVYGLLKLDALESAKMMVRQADCMVESDITHDLAAFLTLILLGAFVVLVLCSTIFVFLENRSVFSDNKETVNLESASNNPVMKEFKIGDDNSVKTNEGIIPVQSLGCDKSVSHLTPQNGGEHQTDVSKDANSTGDGLPNLPHSVEQPRKMKYGVLSKIAKAFALQLNIPKIVSGKTGPNSIGCIHGIRFFTITWVMLCHTYVYLVMTFPNVWSLENPLNYIEMTHNFSFQIILGGTSAVDTFFMLSGMMLSYTQLKNLQTLKTKLTGRNVGGYVFHYFFHRLWRLTPIYMITILMFATVSEYMKSGPLMPTSFPYIENCKESWWTNLLYVNNLVMTDKPCGGWSWYLANDMQFYTVSLLILFMMIFKMPVAILTSLTLMAGGMAYTVYKQYHTKGSLISGASSFQEYWSNIYIAPWCRIAAFLVGLLFGIVMNKRPRKSFSKILNFAGWTTATAVALTLKYSLYDFNRKGGEPWTRWQNAFYEAFDRPVWALCVAWVIFSCHNHMGGPVNSILSWKGLVPLSRISYATYLVHYLIMAAKNNTNYDVFHYTLYNMIYLFLGNTVFSFMAAFVTSLIFEAPFIALGKLML